jgi:glycerol-3-phosphate O-acyltransferase / dihydroxyacetone phosphate acyltransferase
MMLLVTCGRKIGFLTAKKSMDKFWIGLFARAFNSIPVVRPQDLTKAGSGCVYMKLNEPLKLMGKGTEFTKSLSPRCQVSLDQGDSAEVLEIVSDTEAILKKPFTNETAIKHLTADDGWGKVPGCKYKVTPHVDQSNMFGEVVARLHRNQTVGIFPEGGSHDRPNLLPLKPGVSMMVP